MTLSRSTKRPPPETAATQRPIGRGSCSQGRRQRSPVPVARPQRRQRGARDHVARRRLPARPGRAGARASPGRASSRPRRGSPNSGDFGIAAVLVGTVLIALTAIVIAVPFALGDRAATSPSTRRGGIKRVARQPRRPDGRGPERRLRPLGALPAAAEHRSPLVAVDRHLVRLDPDLPGRPTSTRTTRSTSPTIFTSSTFIAGIVVALMVDPDRLLDHARGVLAGADRRARGRARARRDPVGDDPHRRAAVRPRRHDRRHDARPRPGARRDDRRLPDHLARSS